MTLLIMRRFWFVFPILAVLLWIVRLEDLRSRYAAQVARVTTAIEEVTGRAVSADAAPVTIAAIGVLRDRYRNERNEARDVVNRQSISIRALAAEGARQMAIGERNRQLAEATMRERDVWIARAAAAETRTTRASAETEVAECEQVLDALYHDGF